MLMAYSNALGGIGVAVEPEIHVAQLFLDPGCRGVQPRGGAEIVQGRGERFHRVSTMLMCLGTLQVGEHRPTLERNGAAERLDGHKRLPPAQGIVALRDKAAILTIALDHLVGEHAPQGQAGDKEQPPNDPFHK